MNKQLTKQEVLRVANDLFLKNGKTTTLEVKTVLRNEGFWAEQSEVSSYMDQLHAQENWDFTTPGNHRVYTSTVNRGQTSSVASTSSVSPRTNRKKGTKVNLSPAATYGDIANFDKSKHDKNCWIVKHVSASASPVVHIYPASETRDHVRCSYAKMNKFKIQSIRACRIKNL